MNAQLDKYALVLKNKRDKFNQINKVHREFSIKLSRVSKMIISTQR